MDNTRPGFVILTIAGGADETVAFAVSHIEAVRDVPTEGSVVVRSAGEEYYVTASFAEVVTMLLERDWHYNTPATSAGEVHSSRAHAVSECYDDAPSPEVALPGDSVTS